MDTREEYCRGFEDAKRFAIEITHDWEDSDLMDPRTIQAIQWNLEQVTPALYLQSNAEREDVIRRRERRDLTGTMSTEDQILWLKAKLEREQTSHIAEIRYIANELQLKWPTTIEAIIEEIRRLRK
jgi:hypothetical protein